MPEFSPHRSDAIRLALEETVRSRRPASIPSARRWIPGAALLVVGLVAGGAVSAAAVTTFQSRPATEIPAPPGVTPGSPIISLLGASTTTQVDGRAALDLPPAPEGATHVRVTFTCLTPGTFGWGTDAGGNNPSVRCTESDLATGTASSWYDFPLEKKGASLYVQADAGERAVVSFQYLNYIPTALGVNERGETFGAAGGGLSPDLVAVTGIGKNGDEVQGYARSADLDSFGPDWPHQPSSPEEALRWQQERDARYPNGWDVPVYKSDGTTVIGTFHIGG